MSNLPGIQYFIINRETTGDGKSLAINFNGVGAPLTVTEFERLPSQIWRLRDLTGLYIGLQSIEFQDTNIPINIDNDGNLVAALSPSTVSDRKWYVKGNEGIYIIQDDAHRGFWGLKKVVVGEKIIASINERHYWRLIAVPP
ncbi:hypothetical protein L210DRAFT_2456218 [Boletus edulis BED1]|uniref:CCL2-like lectin domain-containing protein n=1 Tax=Boletus edulis BED1 TaxID=1328754 RepID=A0AAD4GCK9_BOLED|nr:hypothetical protein L210DRAFT_2456218 [Boletus edulis BED1]